MNQTNQKKESRFRKLLSLSPKEANFIRNSGIRVPIEDYDVTRVNFNVFFEGWSMKKKLAFTRRVLCSVGLSICKCGDRSYQLKLIDEPTPLTEESLEYLSVRDFDTEEVRSPEFESKIDEVETIIAVETQIP